MTRLVFFYIKCFVDKWKIWLSKVFQPIGSPKIDRRELPVGRLNWPEGQIKPEGKYIKPSALSFLCFTESRINRKSCAVCLRCVGLMMGFPALLVFKNRITPQCTAQRYPTRVIKHILWLFLNTNPVSKFCASNEGWFLRCWSLKSLISSKSSAR